MPLTKGEARAIALSVAGAAERPFFNKPAVFVQDQFLTRIHDKEDAVVVIVPGGIEMRDMMLEAEPRLFYITDHYRKRPILLARLAALDKKTLLDLLGARLLQIAAKPSKRRPLRKRSTKKRKA